MGNDLEGKRKPCPGLTIEKLREFKGFESVSDDEAERIIYSVKELSIILYHHYLNKKGNKNERPPTV